MATTTVAAVITAGMLCGTGTATAAEQSGAASAATTPEAASSPSTVLIGGRCEDDGFVRVNTSAVYIYPLADTTSRSVVGVAYRGAYLSCYKIIAGEPYRLCGTTTPANGYIPVDVEGDTRPDGYVPSTCVTD